MNIMETVPVYTIEQVRLAEAVHRRLRVLVPAYMLAVAVNVTAGLIVLFQRSF